MGFPKKLFRGLPLFALFGAFGTVLDALVSLPLFVVTGSSLLANFVGLLAGSTLSFYLNLRFNFSGVRHSNSTSLAIFVGFGFAAVTLFEATKFFLLSGELSSATFLLLKGLVVGVIFLLKYAFTKKLVFS